MVEWPPTLAELKSDVSPTIPADDTDDDAALTDRLSAAVTFVQRVRRDLFEQDDDGNLIEPIAFTASADQREGQSIRLGTMMLAARLFARRRSPDAILWMAETGTTRLPWSDVDIARLLRIGQHEKPKVA